MAVPSLDAAGIDLRIYEFGVDDNSLTLKASYPAASTGAGWGVSWLQYNEQLYVALAISNPGASNPGLIIFSYDIATSTLSTVTSALADVTVSNVDWLVSGTQPYVVGSVLTSGALVYAFDPAAGTLTSFATISLTGLWTYFVKWFSGFAGRALLAVGGYRGTSAYWRGFNVFGFDLIGTTSSLVFDNTVSNVDGTGIMVNELSDSVLNNKVCNIITPYEPWKPYQFDPSNQILAG
jgi:hypothetical protein